MVNYDIKIDNILYSRSRLDVEYYSDILNNPLKDFYINSSHNSYLKGFQLISDTSYDNIEYSLQSGARCIELDIHEKNNKLVVSHGYSNFLISTYLDLPKCLDLIYNYSLTTSDPIILMLEIVVYNPVNRIIIGDLIRLAFKDKLLPIDNKIIYHKSKIDDIPLKNLLNKIIILNSTSNVGLEEIVDNSGLLNLNNKMAIETSNRLSRVYPIFGLITAFSYNIDPTKYWDKKYNMVALNFQMKDKYLLENTKKFKYCSYIYMY